MNPYMNEDVMWQRLQDVQREAENRRLMADSAADDQAGPGFGSRLRSALSAALLAASRRTASSKSRRAARPAP
jgi:hypothetical protein